MRRRHGVGLQRTVTRTVVHARPQKEQKKLKTMLQSNRFTKWLFKKGFINSVRLNKNAFVINTKLPKDFFKANNLATPPEAFDATDLAWLAHSEAKLEQFKKENEAARADYYKRRVTNEKLRWNETRDLAKHPALATAGVEKFLKQSIAESREIWDKSVVGMSLNKDEFDQFCKSAAVPIYEARALWLVLEQNGLKIIKVKQ